jgi:hypothetical protein
VKLENGLFLTIHSHDWRQNDIKSNIHFQPTILFFMKSIVIFLFLCFAALALADDDRVDEKHVKVLNDKVQYAKNSPRYFFQKFYFESKPTCPIQSQNFDKFVKKGTVWMVEFYAPWSVGHFFDHFFAIFFFLCVSFFFLTMQKKLVRLQVWPLQEPCSRVGFCCVCP